MTVRPAGGYFEVPLCTIGQVISAGDLLVGAKGNAKIVAFEMEPGRGTASRLEPGAWNAGWRVSARNKSGTELYWVSVKIVWP